MKINENNPLWCPVDDTFSQSSILCSLANEKNTLKQTLPEELSSWINYKHSLTTKIRALNPATFAFQLHHEYKDIPSQQEQMALALNATEKVMVREITMTHNHKPYLYGRTLIPEHLFYTTSELNTLGATPIGEILFTKLGGHFTTRYYTLLKPHHALFQAAIALFDIVPPALWARYTVYPFKKQLLLIYEIFFPAIFTS